MTEPRLQDEVFTAEAVEKSAPDGIEEHYWHQARNRIVLRAMQAIPGAREQAVLEVGCGRGLVVQFLRRRGWNATGCELGTPRPITPEIAPNLSLGIRAQDLPPDVRQSVATILLLDVLEHIQDPAEFLRQQIESFPRCTHFVVTLPARQELYSNYDSFYGHYLRYDRRTLRALCQRAEVTLGSHRYFFQSLYAPTLILTRLGFARPVDVQAPSGIMRLVHRSVGFCLAGEPWLLPGAVPGTSLIGVLGVPGQR